MGLHTDTGRGRHVDLGSSRDRKESRTPPIFKTWLCQCWSHIVGWTWKKCWNNVNQCL